MWSHTLLQMRRVPALRPAALAALAGTTAVLVAGCSGGSKQAAAPPPRPVATPTCASAAPAPSATSSQLTKALSKVPFDLPMPSNITVVDATVTKDGINVVRFTTPTSLRDSVLFIVGRYPKAGYVLGRGDAEASEADAPFVKSTVRGLTRIASVDQCKTLWLVASTTVSGGSGTSPLLSPHPTSAVTSALPFG
jgi:hypothetical protein